MKGTQMVKRLFLCLWKVPVLIRMWFAAREVGQTFASPRRDFHSSMSTEPCLPLASFIATRSWLMDELLDCGVSRPCWAFARAWNAASGSHLSVLTAAGLLPGASSAEGSLKLQRAVTNNCTDKPSVISGSVYSMWHQALTWLNLLQSVIKAHI